MKKNNLNVLKMCLAFILLCVVLLLSVSCVQQKEKTRGYEKLSDYIDDERLNKEEILWCDPVYCVGAVKEDDNIAPINGVANAAIGRGRYSDDDPDSLIAVGIAVIGEDLNDYSDKKPKGYSPSVSEEEYSKILEKNELSAELFDFLEKYKNQYAKDVSRDFFESDFIVKAFQFCVDGEYGILNTEKYKSSLDYRKINQNIEIVSRMKEYGFRVVEGDNPDWLAYSSIHQGGINCIVITTPKQLKEFAESKVAEGESYVIYPVPNDPVKASRFFLFREMFGRVTGMGDESDVNGYFDNLINSSSDQAKYKDGKIFCLESDSLAMNSDLFKKYTDLKNAFTAKGLI